MRCVGGVQAATAAQSRARIAARVVYAIDATVTARLRSAGSVRACGCTVLLSEHCALRQLEKVTSTASKGDLAFVRGSSACQKSLCTAFCGRVCCPRLGLEGLRTLAGVSFFARSYFVWLCRRGRTRLR